MWDWAPIDQAIYMDAEIRQMKAELWGRLEKR